MSRDSTFKIPLVDLSIYGLSLVDKSEFDSKELQHLGEELCGAFTEIGFCYIKNHGIPDHKIRKMMDISKEFFEQPFSYKMTSFGREKSKFHGYLAPGVENLNSNRPVGGYKETFNFAPFEGKSIACDRVPEFEAEIASFFETCKKLSLRILDLISYGLHLENKTMLRECHGGIGSTDNVTMLRSLYYPPLPEGQELSPGQILCGEHFDFETLTLLFQDNVGGLQVKNMNGDYIDATPIEGTILINVGETIQRWTADKLVATEHRVVKKASKQTIPRQSMAFFAAPDNDVNLECLDGSNKYEPITCKDFLLSRFNHFQKAMYKS